MAEPLLLLIENWRAASLKKNQLVLSMSLLFYWKHVYTYERVVA